ncbi:MAG: hypothetical protein HS111_28330 [Kofleriaceae bacterium]|nr:hypothetical protein [Kofleriaceae bacterium]
MIGSRPRSRPAATQAGASLVAVAMAALAAACGGGPDGADAPADAATDAAPDRTPAELADDTAPYALPADCAGLPTWELGAERHPQRVAAASAREAWVVVWGDLLHLQPDGAVVAEPLVGVNDVWRCPGVTWAVGRAGLVARKPDGGAWQRLDLELDVPDGFDDVRDGGVGCDGDVWVGGHREAFHHDGAGWRAIPTLPTPFDPDDPGAGHLEHDVARVLGAGRWRVATSNYGETLAYFPELDAFDVVEGTDDLISDAVVFRDGTGATLYHGHALVFDRDVALMHVASPLHAVRAARRADDDIWLVQNATARHFDGATVTDEPTPIFNTDVDARADAVWVAGHGGAAVRSAAGWCHVATVSSP